MGREERPKKARTREPPESEREALKHLAVGSAVSTKDFAVRYEPRFEKGVVKLGVVGEPRAFKRTKTERFDRGSSAEEFKASPHGAAQGPGAKRT